MRLFLTALLSVIVSALACGTAQAQSLATSPTSGTPLQFSGTSAGGSEAAANPGTQAPGLGQGASTANAINRQSGFDPHKSSAICKEAMEPHVISCSGKRQPAAEACDLKPLEEKYDATQAATVSDLHKAEKEGTSGGHKGYESAKKAAALELKPEFIELANNCHKAREECIKTCQSKKQTVLALGEVSHPGSPATATTAEVPAVSCKPQASAAANLIKLAIDACENKMKTQEEAAHKIANTIQNQYDNADSAQNANGAGGEEDPVKSQLKAVQPDIDEQHKMEMAQHGLIYDKYGNLSVGTIDQTRQEAVQQSFAIQSYDVGDPNIQALSGAPVEDSPMMAREVIMPASDTFPDASFKNEELNKIAPQWSPPPLMPSAGTSPSPTPTSPSTSHGTSNISQDQSGGAAPSDSTAQNQKQDSTTNSLANTLAQSVAPQSAVAATSPTIPATAQALPQATEAVMPMQGPSPSRAGVGANTSPALTTSANGGGAAMIGGSTATGATVTTKNTETPSGPMPELPRPREGGPEGSGPAPTTMGGGNLKGGGINPPSNPTPESAAGIQRNLAGALEASTTTTGGGGGVGATIKSWWKGSFSNSLFGGAKGGGFGGADAKKGLNSGDVDLRQFLPKGANGNETGLAGGIGRRPAGVHGPHAILWNAVRGRYHSLEPTLYPADATPQ